MTLDIRDELYMIEYLSKIIADLEDRLKAAHKQIDVNEKKISLLTKQLDKANRLDVNQDP